VAVNTRGEDGSTPLLAAVYGRDVKLVELLLQYSADLAVADAVRDYFQVNDFHADAAVFLC
jgi:ankyrin repeat protein